ncbi:MAG TPA: hypothetical protein VEJ86_02985 [Candidatus Binataceae bacterium]|nr:hypothetical protein [Candidatus Binataceae bacterium]
MIWLSTFWSTARPTANLRQFNLKQIVPGHCTGFRAQTALLNTFGETVVVLSAVGSRFRF